MSRSTIGPSASPGDLVLGLAVLDPHGQVLDGDERIRQRLMRSRSLVRRLLGLGRRAAAIGGSLDHELEPGVRARVFAAEGGVVVFFGAPLPPPRLDMELLTGRERQVVEQVGAGRHDERTAARLGIAVATVRWHLTNVYRKTGLRSRAALQRALREAARGAQRSRGASGASGRASSRSRRTALRV